MNTITKIKTLINSLTKNNIAKININTNNTNIIISKIKTKNENFKKYQTVIKKNNNKKEKNTAIKSTNEDIKNKIEQNNIVQKISGLYSTIVSPMVGTFYRSPAPNENAFIEIEDTIKPKQIVCIIEAMKLMNEIESEIKGEVVEILVKDGDIVDCGQALMKIKIK